MYQMIKRLLPVEEAKNIGLSVEIARQKSDYVRHIQESLTGNGKFLLIIGPCSADNYDAVMSYCEHLKSIYDKVSDKIFIVPRIYTTKPRSLVGKYRGMLHSPNVTGGDINGGIVAARKLMRDVAENFGFFPADEMLYPELYDYFDDLLSYITIGARSSDDQQHRMAASAVDVPVGIKNSLSGDLQNLAQAIKIAMSQNDFAYNGYLVHSSGNKFAHAVLRGTSSHSNYDSESIENFLSECKALEIDSPIIIDCNHGNSGKNFLLEPKVAHEAVNLAKKQKNIRGLMIESYLYDGKQDYPIVNGKSLTDACLGIEKTKRLICQIADAL